jgi:hypothetical protein
MRLSSASLEAFSNLQLSTTPSQIVISSGTMGTALSTAARNRDLTTRPVAQKLSSNTTGSPAQRAVRSSIDSNRAGRSVSVISFSSAACSSSSEEEGTNVIIEMRKLLRIHQKKTKHTLVKLRIHHRKHVSLDPSICACVSSYLFSDLETTDKHLDAVKHVAKEIKLSRRDSELPSSISATRND